METVETHTQAEASSPQVTPAAPAGMQAQPQPDLQIILNTLRSLTRDQLHVLLLQLEPRALLDALQSSLPENSQQPIPKPAASATAEEADAPTRVLKSGKLIYNNSNSVVDCQIREISSKGCKIRVENSIGIPEHPMLQILDGKTKRQCQVAWKKLEEIGLEFID
ncbi:MAG: PilZ domain-containing protein [Pseudomonadota bacterium]